MEKTKTDHKFRKLFLSFDYFGSKPKLLINSTNKLNTITGSFISLIFYTLIALSFFNYGKEHFFKEKPIVTYFKKYNGDENINLNYDLKKLKLFFGIFDFNFKFIDDSYFSVKAYLTYDNKIKNNLYDFHLNNSEYEINLEKCNISKHFNQHRELFLKSNIKFSDYLCIDKSNLDDIILKSNEFHKFSNIRLSINKCDKTICKSDIEIENKKLNSFFKFNTISSIFNHLNNTNYNKYIITEFDSQISYNKNKEIILNYKNVDYYTDEGIILDDLKRKQHLIFDSIENNNINSDQEAFLNCIIKFSNFKEIYIRRYQKLQDILSKIGGFFNFLVIFIKTFYSIFSQTDFYNKLSNKVYLFNFNQKSKEISLPKSNSTASFFINNFFRERDRNQTSMNEKQYEDNRFNTNSHELTNFQNKLENFHKTYKDKKNNLKLKINVVNFVKLSLFCNTKKKSKFINFFYQSLFDNLKKKSNLSYLLKFYDEFKSFKNVILNEDQKKLFNMKTKLNFYNSNNKEDLICFKDFSIYYELIRSDLDDEVNVRIKNEIDKTLEFFK